VSFNKDVDAGSNSLAHGLHDVKAEVEVCPAKGAPGAPKGIELERRIAAAATSFAFAANCSGVRSPRCQPFA
jgi:hypothetical protein